MIQFKIKRIIIILLFSMSSLLCKAESIDDEFAGPHPIGGYNVYMGHLHNHTSLSDGSGSPRDAYLYARDTSRMDFLGITDHAELINTAEWSTLSSAADEFNVDNSFVTFKGFEWSSSNYGHVSVLETADYCSSTDTSTDTFDELTAWIASNNGIAFFNHPGRQNTNGLEFNHFISPPLDNFVGMELWNKMDDFSVYYYNDGYNISDGSLSYYDEAITNGWHIGASGSGDNHSASWGSSEPYRMAVLASVKTRSAISAAFINRRFYSTLDRNLSLSFKINSSEMGSKIVSGYGFVEISADDASPGDTFASVILKKNGTAISTWYPSEKQIYITLDIVTSVNDYYYVIVKQSDGDEAISSPIWIE